MPKLNIALIALTMIALTACQSRSTAAPTQVSVSTTLTIQSTNAATATATDIATATEAPTAAPTETSAPINIVTDLKDIANAPDGSTEEKRAGIAASILGMFANGTIPNFDPSIPAFTPTRDGAFNNSDFKSFIYTHDNLTDNNKRSLMGVTLVQGENGVVYGVQAVKQPGTTAPGLIWYEISDKNSGYEISVLFNQWSSTISLPKGVKGTEACTAEYGRNLCQKYSDPKVFNAQDQATQEYISSGVIPDSMTSGKVIFLMARQGLN